MAKVRRTTHRSASGRKLYAIRDARGRFLTIETQKGSRSRWAHLKSKKAGAARPPKTGGGGGGQGDDDDW